MIALYLGYQLGIEPTWLIRTLGQGIQAVCLFFYYGNGFSDHVKGSSHYTSSGRYQFGDLVFAVQDQINN